MWPSRPHVMAPPSIPAIAPHCPHLLIAQECLCLLHSFIHPFFIVQLYTGLPQSLSANASL